MVIQKIKYALENLSLPPTNTFCYFPELPPELRLLIWEQTVLMAADHSEVLILVPQHVFPLSLYHMSATGRFPLVNTGFPVAMHVSREARDVALRLVMLERLGRGRWNKCLVPQRPFRPEIDTLYAARTAIPTNDFCYEDVQTVQHLALDWSNHIAFDMANFFLFAARGMAALRTIRFVLHGPSQPVLCSDPGVVPLPHRRCALRTIETVLFEQPRVYSTEYDDVVDGDFDKYMSEVVIPSPRGLADSLRVIETLTWKVIYRSIHIAFYQGHVPYSDEEGIGTEILGDLLFEQLCEIRGRFTMETCLMTEFCYSPSGGSRFSAVGEKLPDSDKLHDLPHQHCSFSEWRDAIMQQLKQITW
ncbi:hypothetical protein GGR55DRAFT_649051 [Xylaria sp. FL0064]|nr:hypothetical protein GGR55DRAFT_649051 [Xylaria sp. FL0064]